MLKLTGIRVNPTELALFDKLCKANPKMHSRSEEIRKLIRREIKAKGPRYNIHLPKSPNE